jgi:hypothetical protein
VLIAGTGSPTAKLNTADQEQERIDFFHRVMRKALMSKGLDLRGVCLIMSRRRSTIDRG